MNRPPCHSYQATPLQRTIDLGYAVCCHGYGRSCNEQTGTPCNYFDMATNILLPVLLCRRRTKLSYRQLTKLFLLRGFAFIHLRTATGLPIGR